MIARIILALFLFCSAANAASLLPPGKQQFLGNNGAPLVGGSVYFYVPGTTTPKDTYQDSAGAILNTNPVGLDSGGFAVIYGSGAYREVVKDASGQTIYDQLTAEGSSDQTSWAGSASGSANALILAASGFSAQNGQVISWKNTLTNTGATTLTVGGSTYGLVKDTLSGPIPLSGGELTQTDISSALYDSAIGQFHLIIGNVVAPVVTLASAATTDLGAARSPTVSITGATTITSFGSSATTTLPMYRVIFTSGLTITYNATSLITPTGKDLVLTSGATALLQYRGTGNWTVLDFTNPTKFPTRQVLTTSGTYTTPNGATRLFVRMVAGGGGGGESNGGAAGGNGGNSSFGGVTVGGGGGGPAGTGAFSGLPGAGGTGGTGTTCLRLPGMAGAAGAAQAGGAVVTFGGGGGVSPFGGAGVNDPNGGGFAPAKANSGSGGAGGISGATGNGNGSGGGSGEYAELCINSPAASYAYVIGAGGTATGGASRSGAGGSGRIIVDEYYDLN